MQQLFHLVVVVAVVSLRVGGQNLMVRSSGLLLVILTVADGGLLVAHADGYTVVHESKAALLRSQQSALRAKDSKATPVCSSMNNRLPVGVGGVALLLGPFVGVLVVLHQK